MAAAIMLQRWLDSETQRQIGTLNQEHLAEE